MMDKLYIVAQALTDNWSSRSMLIIIEIEESWNRNKKKEIEYELAYHLEISHLIQHAQCI